MLNSFSYVFVKGLILVDENVKKKSSIIDQVLEDKRRKQEEQKQRQKEQNQYQERLRNEMDAYVRGVLKKVDENKPMFTPRGRFIGDAKWHISSNADGFEAVAKEKLSMKLLIFSATYVPYLDLEKINTLLSENIQRIDSSLSNLSIFSCYVVETCEDEQIQKTFSSFHHYGFFPMLFSINQKKLYYNSSVELMDYFVSWFDPQKQPVTLKEILSLLVDAHGIFTLKSIKDNFIFDTGEAKKMLDSLEKKLIIYHLKGTEYVVNE